MSKGNGSDNLPASESAVMASNVPNVSKVECDGLAIWRVEVFGPRAGGGQRRLDSVHYLCGKHEEDLGKALCYDRRDGNDDFTARLSELEKNDILCGAVRGFVAGEGMEQLGQLDTMLREAREGHRRTYANGYVAGINAAMVDGRVHAFTVTADPEVMDKFRWLCACGWVTFQEPAGSEQTPIQTRLMEHHAEATAVDMRTAQALFVDGCSCPAEIGEHRHRLYVRRLASTGKLAHIVVEARWYDQTGSARMEVLCWPVSAGGLALASRWVSEHAAHWEDGSPVTAQELVRRGAGWLR